MDLILFRALNALTGNGTLGDGVIIFFAAYLQYALGVALVVAALWPRRHIRMFIAAGSAAVVARLGVKSLILAFVSRARPYVALSDVRNIIGPQVGEEFQSFPSGHAVFFFALAMAVFMYNRRLGWWFFAGATLMGIARIAGGIHWPSDIFGGAVLGILTAWLMVRFIPVLRPQK